MTTHEVQVVVIGGGVVGLAAAAAIAGRSRSVVVIERHPRPGMETSTHNSGVIHAGIYYPKPRSRRSSASKGPRGYTGSAPLTVSLTTAAASW